MKHTDIAFLTTNPKKAEDFISHGFSVQAFESEIPEVLSENVETVVLYKAMDAHLNNIVVEDTSLTVQGAEFFGTQIKHVYEEIKENADFNHRHALWQVSLCMRKDDIFYQATGELSGILKYPAAPRGYHFDRIFAVNPQADSSLAHQDYVHFELLTQEQKFNMGPRFQAMQKLIYALDNNDFSQLTITHIKDIQPWQGEYQIEREKKEEKKKPAFR